MSIELRTHTGLWHVEKKLYSFYDVQLPFPVSMRQVGVVVGIGVPWFWLMATIGVTFGPPFGHLLYLAPPFALAWASGKPLMEGKSIGGLISSQIKYLGEARRYARLRPYTEPEMVVVRCELWHPGHVQDRERIAEPQSLVLIPGHTPNKATNQPPHVGSRGPIRDRRTTNPARQTRPARTNLPTAQPQRSRSTAPALTH